jgi:hypothetical protein
MFSGRKIALHGFEALHLLLMYKRSIHYLLGAIDFLKKTLGKLGSVHPIMF